MGGVGAGRSRESGWGDARPRSGHRTPLRDMPLPPPGSFRCRSSLTAGVAGAGAGAPSRPLVLLARALQLLPLQRELPVLHYPFVHLLLQIQRLD